MQWFSIERSLFLDIEAKVSYTDFLSNRDNLLGEINTQWFKEEPSTTRTTDLIKQHAPFLAKEKLSPRLLTQLMLYINYSKNNLVGKELAKLLIDLLKNDITDTYNVSDLKEKYVQLIKLWIITDTKQGLFITKMINNPANKDHSPLFINANHQAFELADILPLISHKRSLNENYLLEYLLFLSIKEEKTVYLVVHNDYGIIPGTIIDEKKLPSILDLGWLILPITRIIFTVIANFDEAWEIENLLHKHKSYQKFLQDIKHRSSITKTATFNVSTKGGNIDISHFRTESWYIEKWDEYKELTKDFGYVTRNKHLWQDANVIVEQKINYKKSKLDSDNKND